MTHPKDLRSRRLALGLSQSELARRLGVPVATLSRWERGEAPIEDPETLFALLDGITADERPPEST
ncbi:MAG: helix-turn-helix domain-containing protein [Thermoanaerobaculia bacterium]